MKPKSRPYSFEEVLDLEYAQIERLSREVELASGTVAKDQLLGLAFSGGGIRSATFNLGVLQALSELKLLKEFDYLSTVSGGGYIGSWMSAWIHRAHLANPKKAGVETGHEKLSPKNSQEDEPKEVGFLRSYSNYLTPKTGLFSTDTLAGVATYLRNLVLNLSVIISCLAVVMLLPRVVAAAGS